MTSQLPESRPESGLAQPLHRQNTVIIVGLCGYGRDGPRRVIAALNVNALAPRARSGSLKVFAARGVAHQVRIRSIGSRRAGSGF